MNTPATVTPDAAPSRVDVRHAQEVSKVIVEGAARFFEGPEPKPFLVRCSGSWCM